MSYFYLHELMVIYLIVSLLKKAKGPKYPYTCISKIYTLTLNFKSYFIVSSCCMSDVDNLGIFFRFFCVFLACLENCCVFCIPAPGGGGQCDVID